MSKDTSMHARVSDLVRNHKSELDQLNFAVTASVASLIFSEFLRNFKKTIQPRLEIKVPAVSQIEELLSPGSHFSNVLADHLIKDMRDSQLIQTNLDLPELVIFNNDNIDALMIVAETTILRNVERNIPSIIRQKFGLNAEGSDRTFYESDKLQMFDGNPFNNDHYHYMTDQAVLQLLMSIPSASDDLVECPNNLSVCLHKSPERVLTIGNQNAITAIHFNEQIISNTTMMELLSFVTDSNFTPTEYTDGPGYTVRSNVYNQLIMGTIRSAPKVTG